MTRRTCPLLAFLLLTAAAAHAGEAADPLLALPTLPKPTAGAIAAPAELKALAPGVFAVTGERVVLAGSVIFDQGPVDGLEVFACLQNGKTHESVVRLTAAGGPVVKAAFIAGLGLADGVPAPESSGMPARGTPLRVVAQWQDPDHAGAWLAVDASCLVRDRVNDQPYPPLPFVYTGSRFLTVEETDPNGKPVKRDRFMLDSTKSVVDIVDEADALLASPFAGAGYDKHFEVNSALCPPPGTALRLVFEKAELPLTLAMLPDGQLRLPNADSAVLGDAELGALLAKHFAVAATPPLRALAVVVAGSTDRAKDVAARSRILALAAAAKAWVMPVFTLSAGR
jgi:hypothetical protein